MPAAYDAAIRLRLLTIMPARNALRWRADDADADSRRRHQQLIDRYPRTQHLPHTQAMACTTRRQVSFLTKASAAQAPFSDITTISLAEP